MRIFSSRCEGFIKRYRILGMRVAIGLNKKALNKKIMQLQQEVDALHLLLNSVVDITQLPKVRGKQQIKQQKNLNLMTTVIKAISQHNLMYWIDFGILLGAVRHKGFIPWDDDIDLCMLRDDYLKASDILKSVFKNTDFEVREEACERNFQIRIKNEDNTIAVDIFPVDEYKSVVKDEKEKELLNQKIKEARQLLETQVSSGLNFKQEIAKITAMICSSKNDSYANTLFYGIDYPHYLEHENVIMERSDIFPLSTIIFEGISLPCPKNPKKHLEELYGDFMSFPKKI